MKWGKVKTKERKIAQIAKGGWRRVVSYHGNLKEEEGGEREEGEGKEERE